MRPRQGAEAPHMGKEGLNDREQQRRDADRHREARNPERRLEIRRRFLAETVGGALKLDQLPQQQRDEPERQHIEDRRRQRSPALRKPRLHKLDLMERIVDLTYREADE